LEFFYELDVGWEIREKDSSFLEGDAIFKRNHQDENDSRNKEEK
jgi:hypothetical protein